MLWQRESHSTWKGLAAGAIGGAAGSLVMNWFQAGVGRLQQQSQQQHSSPDGDRGGRQARREASPPNEEQPATAKAATAVAEKVFHHPLSGQELEHGATAAHYAMGIGSGALYGVAAEHWRAASAGAGTAFAVALWAAGDEVAVPALHLAKGPAQYPPKTHLMALASHVVYGVTTELVRRALRRGVLSK